MKKILSVILLFISAILLIFLFIPSLSFSIETSAANALYSGLHDKLTYYVYDDGTVQIKKCNTSATGEIEIPSSIKGYPVTTIFNSAFKNCSGITSLVIPDSVEIIGSSAFENCSNLESVTIGNGVTEINSSFYGCNNLSRVNIKDLEAWCKIDFSSNDSNPLYYAKKLFLNNDEVTDLVIPDSISAISDRAFINCESIDSVTLHDGITMVGENSFSGCNIKILKFAEGTQTINPVAVVSKTSLVDIVIPETVTTIEMNAFSGCSKIEEITIPTSIARIEDNAFYNCTNLKAVNIISLKSWCELSFADYDSNPLYYANNLYLNGKLVTDLIIPDGTTSVENYSFYNYNKLTNLKLSSGVTRIGYKAFYNCKNITNIDISDNVTSIEYYAFENCLGLTNVEIPNNVEIICEGAFKGCNNLTSISLPFIGSSSTSNNSEYSVLGHIFGSTTTSGTGTTCQFFNSSGSRKYYYIPSSLKTVIITDATIIPCGAFYNCMNISSITIPDSVTYIDELAFYGCTGLTRLYIPKGVKSFKGNALQNCQELVDIEVSKDNPYYDSRDNCNAIVETSTDTLVAGCNNTIITNNIKNIGNYAFSYCRGITNIIIPNNVISIGSGAFEECINLESITIPESVTSIGPSAFYKCKSLLSIVLPNKLINIDGDTFYGCTRLKTVTIGNRVTSIESSAFKDCTSLASITLPSGLKSIEANAFYGCTKLITITIPESTETIGNNAFYGCTGIKTVNYNAINCTSFASVSYPAFNNCTNLNTVIIGNQVTSIPKYFLYKSTSLKTVIIGNNVTEIGYCAFENCSNLESVILPNSLEYVSKYAFSGCTRLKDVWYCGSENDKAAINIISFNSPLINAKWHYNICSQEHTYSGICDATCNTCEWTRETTYEHSFSSACDEVCNDCYYIRKTSVEHTFTNNCDNECNNCDHVRTITHTYDNSCDSDCNICGFVRTVSDHNYTINGGYTCDICKYSKTPTAPVVESKTYSSITLVKTNGFEYSKDGVIWQTSNVFSNLFAETTYVFYQRVKSSDSASVSETSPALIVVTNEEPVYMVVFKNWDGTILSTNIYHYGDTVVAPSTPTKASNNTYTYTFNGWDKTVVNCNGDATYTATYTATYIDYTIVFKNWDGSIISGKTYHYGDTVVAPSTPTKTSDNTYTYTFNGWDKTVVNCNGDATYTATYKSNYIDYTITFKNWDGSVISTKTYHYGDSVTVPTTPTRPNDDKYSYTFKSWDKTVTNCNGDAVYTATYTAISLVPNKVTSTEFSITGNNVSKITAGTTVSSLLAGLNEGEYCKVYKDGTQVGSDKAVGTGMVVRIMDGSTVKAEYTVIVTGDTNGDGNITITDMIAIKAHVLEKTLLGGVYATAADTSGDGKISLTDFIQVKSKILGKSEIVAR